MTSADRRMAAIVAWTLVKEGVRPHDDDVWWFAFIAVVEGIALAYGIDFLWNVATGRRLHGMADQEVYPEEYVRGVRDDFTELGVKLPEVR